MEEIVVSVICNTYNQEKYIGRAIKSILDQKTNFSFEILIHDDASVDNTTKIIKEYEEKYPDIIKPIYQTENQYSKGVDITVNYQYPRVQGEYIAFCEGDDFWIDREKLQRQVDALKEHPEINICAHSAIAVNANTERKLYDIAPDNKTCILNVEQVIQGGGGFVATNSLMIRRKVSNTIPEYYKYFPIDYALQIQGSIENGMLFLENMMAAYRVMADNSWSLLMHNNPLKRYQVNLKIIEMLKILNRETNQKYERTIKEKCDELEYWNLYYEGKYREMKKDKMMYQKLSSRDKTIISFRRYIPRGVIETLIKIKRKHW